MTTIDIGIRATIIESMLKVWKTQLFHEIKIAKLKEYDDCIKIAKRKDKRLLEKEKKKTEQLFDKKIQMSEKYNSECYNATCELNGKETSDHFLDAMCDIFNDFFQVIINSTKNITHDKPKDLTPAILERNDNGDIIIDGNKYILHVK